MLEAMATIILVIVGVVLFVFILAYGIYITFYPLRKTIGGGMEAMREYAEEKKKETVTVPKKEYVRAPAAPLHLARQEAHHKKS